MFGNVIYSLKEKKDQLPKAKQMAIRGSRMAKVQHLKFEINGLLKKKRCGNKGPEHNGDMKGIKILDISKAKPMLSG